MFIPLLNVQYHLHLLLHEHLGKEKVVWTLPVLKRKHGTCNVAKKHDVFHFFHIIIVFPNLEASSETVPLTQLYTYGDIILYMIFNLLQNTQSFRYTHLFWRRFPGKPMFFRSTSNFHLRPPQPNHHIFFLPPLRPCGWWSASPWNPWH